MLTNKEFSDHHQEWSVLAHLAGPLHGVVLARRSRDGKFVTWRYNTELSEAYGYVAGTYWGHYHCVSDHAAAVADFGERVQTLLRNLQCQWADIAEKDPTQRAFDFSPQANAYQAG